MGTIDVTAIVAAVVTMVSGWVNWWLDRKKHKQEIESLKADNRMKDMELAQKFVDEFIKNIVRPLEARVDELTNEVNRLKDAIEKVNECPYRDNCPVRHKRVRKQSQDDGR